MFKRLVSGRMVAAAVVVAVALPIVAFAQAPSGPTVDQMRARQRVSTMEVALQQAVTYGADNVIFRVRNVMGDQPILLGAPRVRGFRLEGYGIFFDVEVPDLRVPILWPVRNVMADTRMTEAWLAELRLVAAEMEDRESRELLRAAIARLEGQPGLARSVSAASIAPEVSPLPAAVSAPAAAAPALPPIDDPQEEYRRQVKAELVDAMLENSQNLAIGPDEWLTVGARRNVTRDPLFPGDSVGVTTWVARVKGGVLADLAAKRISTEQARKLVEQREQ